MDAACDIHWQDASWKDAVVVVDENDINCRGCSLSQMARDDYVTSWY